MPSAPQWEQFHPYPGLVAATQLLQEEPRASPELLHISQRAPAREEEKEESTVVLSLDCPQTTVCRMVEDPYFDTPMSSPSSDEAPTDAATDIQQWTDSPVFMPVLHLNDQPVEHDFPASGV